MNFKVHLYESVLNLFSAKLRSILAVLGILVGTGAVVALMASSRLATDHALAQFKALGTNLLAFTLHDKLNQSNESNEGMENSMLTLDEMPKIRHASPKIITAAPFIHFYQPVVVFGKQMGSSVIAATDRIQPIVKIYLTAGRFISFLDRNEFYCVIGSGLAKTFRAHHVSPLGKQIRVGDTLFTVIGVAAPWQVNLFLLMDLNKTVIVPLRAAYLLQSHAQIRDILFLLDKHSNLQKVQHDIAKTVHQIVPNKAFHFRNPQQIIELVRRERQTFNDLLIAIGSIALVVGGIGVMNIMLVSVIERRREIGIRMAVGARRVNILIMFLIEAIMLTVFGGLVGVLLGLGVTYILAYVAGWGFGFYWMPPFLGLIVSVLIGILSGFYPAWRASKLDPIACLRQ